MAWIESPILSGIEPENLLFDRSNTSTDATTGFGRGMGPSNWLELKSIDPNSATFSRLGS